jgi:membrane protein implicated in regulation of membrane protease activity
MFNAFVFCIAFLVMAIAITALLLWRHKKSAHSEINLLGALALVEESLTPEGAVLVRGELWRARLAPTHAAAYSNANCSLGIERGSSVRVVGASGYLLEVEPVK